jgi:hypothetical protein
MHQDNKENNIDHRCRKDFELKEKKIKVKRTSNRLPWLTTTGKAVRERRKKKTKHIQNNVSNNFGY